VKCVYVAYDKDWNCTATVVTAVGKSAPKGEENCLTHCQRYWSSTWNEINTSII